MIARRLARPLAVLLAVLFLWQICSSDFKLWILPVVDQILAVNTTQSLAEPVPAPVKHLPTIAKVTVAANKLDSALIRRALQTHQVQNEMHGYHHYIATNELVDDISEQDRHHRPRGAWSKPAYLLSILVAELAKPEKERLKWVFWFDADTIIMNPHTPLEIFLPPDDTMPEVSNVDLLMASNWDGLNSGAFALRVDPWSVSLLSLVLAYPIYLPAKLKTDPFRDQSAFQWLLQSHESPLANDRTGFTRRNHWEHWADVPMRWFNSLPINNAFPKGKPWVYSHNMTDDLFDNGTMQVANDGMGPRVHPWKVMQGDMVVHFAGSSGVRESWMGRWLDRCEANLPEWSNATTAKELRAAAIDFWAWTSTRMEHDRARVKQKVREEEKERKEKEENEKKLKEEKVKEEKVKNLKDSKLRQPSRHKLNQTSSAVNISVFRPQT